MKNSSRSSQMAAGRACAVYLLAFVLMLFLDADRFSAFLEQGCAAFPPAAEIGQALERMANSAGLNALIEKGELQITALLPQDTIGDAAESEENQAQSPSHDIGPEEAGQTAESVDSVGESQPSPEAGQKAPDPAVEGHSAPSVPAGSGGGTEDRKRLRPEREKPTVLLIGDSMMMEGFGPALQRRLRNRQDMVVIREGKYSTGLSRQDYFDWHAQLEKLVAKHDPDLIVICMGANDAQDITDDKHRRHHVDSPGWKEEYRRRADRLLVIAKERGAGVVWVGLPVMSKEPYAGRIRRLGDIQKQACADAGVEFVDTLRTLADGQGRYMTFMRDSRGRHVRLRYKDMVHVTEDGGALLALEVEPAAERALGLDPRETAPQQTETESPAAALPETGDERQPAAAQESPVPVEAVPTSPASPAPSEALPGHVFTVASEQRGEQVVCAAFLPEEVQPGERFPVIYLLHGAFGNSEVWRSKAGALLQELATRERLVFIAPSCGEKSWYVDSPCQPKQRIESFLIRELLPYVDRTFPVLPRRGILGTSMGGHGALMLALRHRGRFASASSLSGVMDLARHAGKWKIGEVLGPLQSNRALWESYSVLSLLDQAMPVGSPRMMVSIGEEEPALLEENRLFRDALRRGGFIYQYREIPGKHDWDTWLKELPVHIAFHAAVLRQP